MKDVISPTIRSKKGVKFENIKKRKSPVKLHINCVVNVLQFICFWLKISKKANSFSLFRIFFFKIKDVFIGKANISKGSC